MIDPRAVADFLGEHRDDHSWIKALPVHELDQALAQLEPPPRFRSPVRKHQKACFLLGVAHEVFFFQLGMGTGKTSLNLEIVQYLIDSGRADRFLVTCPTEEVVVGWGEEMEKWGFDFQYVPLLGSSEQKWDALAGLSQGVAVITYQGLCAMVSEIVREKGKKRGEMKPVPRKVRALTKRLDGLILDESTFVGNARSLYFRVCNQVSKETLYHYGLAGRAFGRDPEMLWSQCYLIDRGETFGETIGLFREAFFTKKKSHWGGPYSFEYKFDKRMEPDLARMLCHRSVYYSPDDAELDLPPCVPIVRKTCIPASTEAYLEQCKKELRQAEGDRRKIENAFLRMRQVSSGFLGFTDDETGDKAQIVFEENPKLDLLLSLIDEMPTEAKGVIIYEFNHSGNVISEALKKLKIKHGQVWSGTKDYASLKKKFDTEPDFRFLLVNHKKGGYGLNLQSASYTFFYESPVSPIDRDQAEKRVHRQGQLASRVFQYDLVVKGTMDQRILDYHKEGADLFNALIHQPDYDLE